MNPKKKIIIDTDLGDDIDDAFAVLIAAVSDEIDVLGITTVYRCPEARAKMTSYLLEKAGYNVNIYCGNKYPLKAKSIWGKAIDFDSLPWSYSKDYDNQKIQNETAFDFYCRILETTQDVTIVTLGPLTNIAELFTKRADLITKIKKLVIMGGAFTLNRSEYNIVCDPDAAKIVFESGCAMDLVGLDVTLRCEIPNDKLEMLWRRGGVFQILYNMRKLWGNRVILHDPLALMSVIDDSILKFENAVISAETKGEFTKGMTVVLSDNDWKVSKEKTKTRMAVDVDVPRFTEEIFKRLQLLDKRTDKIENKKLC